MTILSQSQLYSLASSTGLTPAQSSIASAIAMAESGGNTDAINPGSATDNEYSVGLWQINVKAHPQYSISSLKDAQTNAKAMFAISSGGTNWFPWGTYTNGSYKNFLNASQPSASQTGTSLSLSVSQYPSQNNRSSFSTLSSFTPTNPSTTTDLGSGFAYVLAYLVAIFIFVLIARTRVGYNALYYGASLLLMLLVVTQANWFYRVLQPIEVNDPWASPSLSSPITPIGLTPLPGQPIMRKGI